MRSLLDVLRKPPRVVDCGTCPVSIACALERGGTGWTYNCCRSTAVEVDGTILIIDCQRHRFEQTATATACKVCPLCSGDLMTIALRDPEDANQYVPTVHAKIPLAERLRLWRKVLPEHRRRREAKIKATT